ncbi:MAG: hypothetical protein WB554_08325, partial [Desulfomonilaceae bacterium]
MKNTLMESRVRSLEEMMADLIATVEQTSLEMREDTARLKEDLRASNEHMEKDTANFKEKTDVTLYRMEEDTARLKGDLRASQDRMERDHRNLNKQLGEIANKQGRMTEDLLAPSVCRILQEVVNCPPNLGCGFLVRPRRVHPKDRSR